MDVGVVVVERDRPLELELHLAEGCVLVRRPAIAPGLAQDAAAPGMGVRIVGIERQRPVDHLLGLDIVLARALVMQHLGGQRALVGRHAGRLHARDLVVLGGFQAARQGGDDGAGDLVLHGEDIVELAVVALGPDVHVGRRVDELDGNAQPVARLAHAALDQIARAELLGDLAHVDGLSLVDEGRVARDDEQFAPAAQLCEDVLGEPIGEEFLLGIAAHVGERQDGNAGLDHGPPLRPAVRRGPALRLAVGPGRTR